MADFIDAFVIGEGEDAILEIAQTLQAMPGAAREAQLRALAQIEGVYVPRFYEVEYHPDSTIRQVTPTHPDAPPRVRKRLVPELPAPFTRFLVPHVNTVHNRAPIEIMRGCTRGCRFCHAGMVTRPVRERPVETVLAAAEEIVRNTGFEELGLLSLSSSDYTPVQELVEALAERFDGQQVSVGLPSLRIESVSVDLMDALSDARRGGFTFAPEAATEKMRTIINKGISDDQLLSTVRDTYARGWRTIKLYFMIGHPSETLDDVQAIVDLARAVLAEGRQIHGNKAKVNVGVSTFVPKPHTPFQWVALDTEDQIRAKQDLLKRGLRGRGLNLRWNQPEETLLEAFLSRGDRRLGAVIQRAWELGTRFDGWQEHYDHAAWQQAFAENSLDIGFYTYRPRPLDEVFPWDHINIGVKKSFLAQDYEMSQRGELREDCRNQCYACGILPVFREMRMDTPADAWQCPPVVPRQQRASS